MCYHVALCVLSQEQIGRRHVCVEYTQIVVKILLSSAPKKYCAGKMRIHYFPGKFFSYEIQTKMVIASGSENKMSSRHSLGDLFPGGEPCIYYNPQQKK